MTDVLTGWTFTRSIRNNAEKHIIPLDLLKKEQEQLTSSILAIQRELDGYTADAALVEQHLTQALDLLEDCQRLYLAVPNRLKKLLNQVFFERILVNPAVDEDGRPIIPPPALQTSLKARQRGGAGRTKAGEKMTAAQGGEKTAESATSSRGEGAGGQSGGSASQGGHDEAQPGPAHTVHRSTISIIDPASHTTVTRELASPFDQLGSQQLRRATQQAVMGAAPTTRTPVHNVDGRRRCNSGDNSTSTPVTQAKGSYTELVVALLTSVTKNWQTLLEFARTLPPEGEVPTTTATDDGRVPTAAAPLATDDGTTTTTIATPPSQRLRQHHTRLTPAQKDEVVVLYQQGVPVREICQRYGISRQQVSDLRNARGIPRRPRGLSDEQKRQAEQHYLAGQSCAAIGRQFGVHAETVRRYLHTAGIALRPRPGAA